LPIVIVIVFVISYLSLHKLVYISRNTKMEGEKLEIFAKRIRDNLIKKDGAEQFSCVTPDNIRLSGLVIERKNPIATLVLCHGYRCCKELTASYVKMFPKCNTVMFDFRSHGENKRSLTTIGCHEHKDVTTIAKWIKKNKPNLAKVPLIILGVSMGGASALKAAENDPTICDALIVDSSFSNLRSMLYKTFVDKSGLPTFPFFYVMKKMFNYLGACDLDKMKPLDSVKKIKKPLLLIHSCIDSFVPVQESLLMYAQGAKTGAKLWIAPECKHGWLHKRYPGLYKKKVSKFLDKKVFI